MPVVDTSVLVALHNPEDAHHGDARKLAERPGPFVVPGVVLAEFLAVVASRVRKAQGPKVAAREGRAVLARFQAQPAFELETAYDAARVAALYLAYEALSYPDAVGLEVARSRGQELLTFDAAQSAVGRKERGAR